MKVRRIVLNAIAAFCILAEPALATAGQIEFFFTGTPDPGAGKYAGTVGFGVSSNGVVAATTNLGTPGEQAFTYTTGNSVYSLAEPGRALAISADGGRVAGFVTSATAGTGALSWQAGTQNFVRLDTLLGYTQGSAISANGQLVAGVGANQMASWNNDGTGSTSLGQVPGWAPTATFGWAGAVSNNGVVAGTSGYIGQANNPRVAVIAQAGVAGSTVQLGQGALDNSLLDRYAKVLGITSDGTYMVGESNVQDGAGVVTHAFVVDTTIATTLIDMSLPSGFTQGRAQGVSDGGAGSSIAVGSSWNGTLAASDTTNLSATIWLPGLGPKLLADVATNDWGVDLTGYRLLTANAISQNGRYITGSAVNLTNGNQVGYLLLNPVPEPASMISLAVGLGLTLYARNRRKVSA